MKAFIGFAGFGGPEIALHKSGIETVSIEKDADIAGVARLNGHNVITSDLLDVNPDEFIGFNIGHFSPPCPNFSLANAGREESELDIALARWIARFIVVVQPEFFTLENVWAYRNSQSWGITLDALQDMGYGVDFWHLNAADYGVPQTRKRMIVIARHDGIKPQKPFPTHSKTGDIFTKPWLGWYQAIEDLIPELPETKPAPWQVDRFPPELQTYLMMTSNTNCNGIDNRPGRGYLDVSSPANTVVAGPGMPKAFLIGQGQWSRPKSPVSPADTVTGNTNQTGVKALLISSQNTSNNPITHRINNEPMFTVVANALEKNSAPKAFIVDGQYQTPSTVKNRVVQNRNGDRPNWTITASEHGVTRAYTNGYWVSMTPEALARFQDFPRQFILPGKRELACRGIGNALPPGVYRATLRSLEVL